MNRLERAFQKGKAFIPFITAGDPGLEVTEKLVIELAKAGADIVELGIPFSDPVCEGPVVQRADERSLIAGFTTDRLFESVIKIREKTDVPIVFLTYLNPVFVYGPEKFLKNCSETGVDGIIVLDMPFDERGEISEECKKYGVKLISMASPNTKQKVQKIAQGSEGFLFCMAPMDTSDDNFDLTADFAEMVSQSKEVSDIPCAICSGLSTPEQAKMLSRECDGLITGTEIIEYVEEYGDNCLEPILDYVREMKSAIMGGNIDKVSVSL